ncbi:MAG: deoxyribose-phosphate aldolase [Candidatus Cloacimonetes bacterium]|nr:deoxyribose-phosphate aldolase [Candidatus Cloacimonadota bacterium]
MKEIRDIALALWGGSSPCKCGGGHEVCLNCKVCRAGIPDRIASDGSDLSSLIDATILKADAVTTDIDQLCITALEYNCASVCVNSIFLPRVKATLCPPVKTCTVINFPLGAASPEAVKTEAQTVCDLGADEVDMVHSISSILDRHVDTAYEVVAGVTDVCVGHGALLKVIIETCYLNREQIIISCLIAKKAGADFVKTSTGFGNAGATAENIALMRATVGGKLGVKASGGIRTREQAIQMVAAGANRIGASNVLMLLS